MKFVWLFLFVDFISVALANRAYMPKYLMVPKKTRGTGRTSTRRPDATPRIYFQFEGVDYDLMPADLKKKNNDCHAQMGWCIHHQSIMNPVCGWNHRSYYFDDYYSVCEIELQNCKFRLSRKKPMKGNDMRDDNIYYNGEGYDCKYYARMGGNMLENYFGPDYKRLGVDKKPYRIYPELRSQNNIPDYY